MIEAAEAQIFSVLFTALSRLSLVMLVALLVELLLLLVGRVARRLGERLALLVYIAALLDALRGFVLLWGTLIGLYLIVFFETVTADVQFLVQRVTMVVAIVSLTLFAMRAGSHLVTERINRSSNQMPSLTIVQNVLRVVTLGLGALVLLQSMGFSITPALAALGVGGLALSLALQDTLSNLFSGLQILVTQEIKPGDYVRLEDGHEGYVVDMNWRNIKILDILNNMVVVPNSTFTSAIITNYFEPNPELYIVVPVRVAYDVDLVLVEEITKEVAREVLAEVPGGIPDAEPLIRYFAFGDIGIDFNVVVRTLEYANQYAVKHVLLQRLHACYRERGIALPHPVRIVYMQSSNSNHGTIEGSTLGNQQHPSEIRSDA